MSLLTALPALIHDAHDLDARTWPASHETIGDRIIGARDHQQAVARLVRNVPAQAGVLLQVINRALDRLDRGMSM